MKFTQPIIIAAEPIKQTKNVEVTAPVKRLEEAQTRLNEVNQILNDEQVLLRIKNLEARNVIAGMNFLNNIPNVQTQTDNFIEEELNKEEMLLDMKRLEINNINAAINEFNEEKAMLEEIIEEENVKAMNCFFGNDKEDEQISPDMINYIGSKLFPKGAGQIIYNEDGTVSIVAKK